MIGTSVAIREVRAQIQRIGPLDLPVLIVGESGTGKELVAKAIHSARGIGEFVPLNCAALPEALLESELFGHVRGAFTGASQDRKGIFEQADGGTLFLDEIGELPITLQAKLLRALELGEVRRVGESRARHVKVRIIAATNRKLEDEIASHRFREDLYWRLRGIQIDMPPLRERLGDIALLARHFASDVPISSDAHRLLEGHSWPGNVRELRSAIESAVALRNGADVTRADLPAAVRNGHLMTVGPGDNSVPSKTVDTSDSESLSLAAAERAHVAGVLRRVHWTKTRAAVLLEISRSRLDRLIRVHQLEPPDS
jgi:transcriptional regulator with GAF, ATPase, and Fis domain